MRGSTGSLVPREDSIELIPAQTDATVVRIRVLPGAKVTPDTILMDLADPQLEQELLNAQLALKGAEADYKSLQATLQSTLMDKKTAAAQVNADYTRTSCRRRPTRRSTIWASSPACVQQVKEHGRPVDRAAQAQPASNSM